MASTPTAADDDRIAPRRGKRLAKTSELTEPEARALAYRWQGYSHSGIAKRVDRTEATVATYMKRAEDLFGPRVTQTKLPGEPHDLPGYRGDQQ